jgi:ribosomal protein S18 acetylase RimI-like enzyme
MSLEESVTDPISFDVMSEAMALPCGHSFDKKTVDDWLAAHDTCPLCNAKTSAADVRPNWALRAVIEALKDSKSASSRESRESSESESESDDKADAPRAAQSRSRELEPQGAQPPFSLLDGEVVLVVGKDQRGLLHQISSMMADSFLASDDIFCSYVWPDRHESSMRWFFETITNFCARNGKVFAMFECGKLVAASLWQPPQRFGASGVSLTTLITSGMAKAPFVMGLKSTKRLARSVRVGEKEHLAAISDAHWSLYSIAVKPSAQNRLVGSRLMQHVLDLCDRDRVAAYVDTTSPRTEPFFQRLGFQVHSRLRGLDAGVPPFTVLIRAPTASASKQK